MPTAVTMLSTENTRSSATICAIAEAKPIGGAACGLVVAALDVIVDLLRRLGEQEEAAGEQHEVAQRETVAEQRKQRRGEADEPGDGAEQHKPHDERDAEADNPRRLALRRRHPPRHQREKNQIVDAEHQLHRDQRRQRRPRGGIDQQAVEFAHGRESSSST